MTCVMSVVLSGYSGFLHRDITEILLKVALNTFFFQIGVHNIWLTDHLISVYFTESPNIHCHYMKDNVQFTTVNEVYHIDINLTYLKENRWSITHSNMTSFFRCVNKQASYPFGKISLAHAPVNVTYFFIGSINCNPNNADRGRIIIRVT